VTDAPEAPPTVETIESTEPEPILAAFRRQLEGQQSVPASVVQDHLLDLWGSLPEGDIRAQIEHWLTETLERNLYNASDVDARLTSVLADD
jgi:hypothetical protein